ncbi:protein FAM19A5 isoform X1 [Astyanax mexicanus]|uniref:Protein FAM19A5 isoform X1 n=1 Tax=Astyanax mexicanus TaxID=7994 RepID=A0A8T2MEZ9_ASTMX|nr:protein FAM19A5 isoform X1 [Astyanax mexicanus]
MAPASRLSRRKDAVAWPRMSATFWTVLLLITLLIVYCGQLAAGTCEIVTLDRDSSQPRRTIARQTARCACKKGQIAGTTRARPACVDARIVRTKQWCDMVPCLEDEGCDLLVNRSGWTCTQPGGRVKTTTVRLHTSLSISSSSLLFSLAWGRGLIVQTGYSLFFKRGTCHLLKSLCCGIESILRCIVWTFSYLKVVTPSHLLTFSVKRIQCERESHHSFIKLPRKIIYHSRRDH